MKNLPHQINNLSRFRAALEVFAGLIRDGANVDDDGVVGRAMAVADVYQFRDKAIDLQEALRIEENKPFSSQGTRTFARDLRRSFLLFGFLEEVPGAGLGLTDRARHLLQLADDSPDAAALWRTALRQLTLVGNDGRVSYPYRTLLRLVEAHPGVATAKLGLALEVEDDSEEEFARISELAQRDDWDRVLKDTGVSEHMIRNSVKVLPALARQLGDIQEDADGNRLSQPAQQRQHRATESARPTSLHRAVKAANVAAAPVRQARTPDEEDYADPALAIELRIQRLSRHNALLRRFAAVVSDAGFALYEHPYDLLGVHRAHPAILTEAKTLDGTALDELARVRGAVAQLLYYEWFSIPSDYRVNGVLRIALFEAPISESHQAFLQSHAIVTVWAQGEAFAGPDWSAMKLQEIDITL